MNLIPLNVILKMLRDPTYGSTGAYANGYRDALAQVERELKGFLETYTQEDVPQKKSKVFEPL